MNVIRKVATDDEKTEVYIGPRIYGSNENDQRERRITSVSQGRPGELLDRYSADRAGDRDTAAEADGEVVTGAAGEAVRITGAGDIALRDRIAIADAQRITPEWKFIRVTDPTDPAGDTVRTGVAWLDKDKALIQNALTQDVTLTVADGEQRRTVTINTSDAPSNAVYIVPWLKTFGSDGVTEVRALQVAFGLEAPNIIFPPEFEFPPEVLPPLESDEPVARTFYVTMDGDDSNSGENLSNPLATPNAAIQKMEDLGLPCVTIIHPGTYEVQPDTDVPDNCAVYGYDAYVTSFRLPDGQEENNMLRIGSGTKVRGITFKNLRHEAYDFDTATNTYDPPRKGFAISWRPGAFVTRLPYVMDCAMRPAVADDQEAMFAPLDRENGNPLMPRGGGCVIADPSVIDPNSPQKIIAAFSFTAVNPNGVAYVVLDDAFMQLVSIYTNYSRIGFWAHNGGQTTVKNGDSTFGDWSFVATGFRRTIRIPDDIVPPPAASAAQAAAIENNIDAIVSNAESRWAQRSWWGAFSTQQREFTRRDARTLLGFLAGDRASGQALGVQAFTKGLFDANADYVFNSSLLSAFLESFVDIEDAIVAVTGTARAPLDTLISVPETVLANPDDYRVNIGSRCLAQPHGMTNSGGGVNYNARPFQFRGTAFVPPPDETILENDGGLVSINWLQEQGDMRLARDLYVDADRSTIIGTAFRRSVQATTLPLTIALGGL